MRYKIRDIPSEGQLVDLPLERALFADALQGLDADLDQTSGSVRFDVHKNRDEIYVSGSLKALVVLPCGACLKPATVLIDTPVKGVYTREDEGGADEADDDEEQLDDADFWHHDGDMLDLRPMVREQVILSLPLAPRCKEDCRGLCATCGEDLNLRDCGHKPESLLEDATDPRLAALKSLKLE